jgi:ParB family chromosome partitioning protein
MARPKKTEAAAEAVTTQAAPSGITTLPLSALLLSDLNVRTTERDVDIAALADDIAARGLKQNLVVVPAHFTTSKVEETEGTDRWAGKFEVIAGGRRFQAMKLLAADGRLAQDHPVPVLVEDRADASETSLSENLHKVAMNPADEFAAFRTIVSQRLKAGESETAAIAYAAKRFGKTVSYIEGRMRLASLCSEVLEALRANEITLDKAMAYAGTTDHDLQERVFKDSKKFSYWTAKDIRAALRNRTVPLDDPLAQFVGLVTYKAEGGRIEAEMFMGTDGEQRLIDVPLLERLAKKIAEEAIPALAKADGVKEGVYAPGVGSYYAKWPKAPKGYTEGSRYYENPSKEDLANSIGVYALDWVKDGEAGGNVVKLRRVGRFKPDVKAETPKIPQRDWAAEQRREDIRDRAAMMAAHKLATNLIDADRRDHFILPEPGEDYFNIIDEDEAVEDQLLVAFRIRVPKAEVEALLAQAEIDHDAAAAARQAEREAANTAPQPDDDDDDANELATDQAEG